MTLLLVAVGGLAVVGPTLAQDEGDDEDAQEPGSQIRLVHAVPGGPAVDVYIDGERVLQEVEPGSVAEYQAVEPGNHSIVMVAAEEPGGVVLDTEIETEERGNYTIAATGQFEDGEAQVEPVALLDNATVPNGEFASVRLGHLVPNASAVTVTLNGTGGVVFEDVEFGESTPYKTIPEGEYTLDVRTGGPDGDVIATVDADLSGGEATSLLAIGAENGTLQVLQQTDPTGPAELSPDIVPQPNGDEPDDTEANDTDGNETAADDTENETEGEPVDGNGTDVTEEVTEETEDTPDDGAGEDAEDEDTPDEGTEEGADETDEEAATDETDEETETIAPEG